MNQIDEFARILDEGLAALLDEVQRLKISDGPHQVYGACLLPDHYQSSESAS
jgi:hypothetical protein